MESDDGNQEFEEKNYQRYDIKDLLRELCQVVGFPEVFSIIAGKITESIAKMEESMNSKTWAKFESELYCTYSIMKVADSSDPTTLHIVQSLLELLLKINFEKPKVLHTALLIVKKGAKFFESKYEIYESGSNFSRALSSFW